MMEKVKIGNDIRLEFTILENGVLADMSSVQDLVIKLWNKEKNATLSFVSDYSANPIAIEVKGRDQEMLGLYWVSVDYKENDGSQPDGLADRSVDSPAFELVEHSFEQGGDSCCPEVELVTVMLVGEVGLGSLKIQPADNENLGTIQGNDIEGGVVFVEPGKGSVKGWEGKASQGALETLEENVLQVNQNLAQAFDDIQELKDSIGDLNLILDEINGEVV